MKEDTRKSFIRKHEIGSDDFVGFIDISWYVYARVRKQSTAFLRKFRYECLSKFSRFHLTIHVADVIKEDVNLRF